MYYLALGILSIDLGSFPQLKWKLLAAFLLLLGLLLLASNLYLIYLWRTERKKTRQLKESNNLFFGNSRSNFVRARSSDSFLRAEALFIREEEQHPQECREFLQQLLSVVEENLSDTPLNAQKLSQLLFLSYPTCLRKVKTATGMTIKECLRHIRIHQATRQLMAKPKQSINDIAWEVGYSSNTHFSRDFKRVMGCTPTEFRERRNPESWV